MQSLNIMFKLLAAHDLPYTLVHEIVRKTFIKSWSRKKNRFVFSTRCKQITEHFATENKQFVWECRVHVLFEGEEAQYARDRFLSRNCDRFYTIPEKFSCSGAKCLFNLFYQSINLVVFKILWTNHVNCKARKFIVQNICIQINKCDQKSYFSYSSRH